MEPPIFAIIRERFVTCVDNRPIKLHPLINIVDDMIRPLTDLKRDMPWSIGHFEVESQRIGLPNPAGAGKDLSGGQKCE